MTASMTTPERSSGKSTKLELSSGSTRSTVLAAIIAASGTMARRDLAERTALSQPTVSRLVDKLISEGLVEEGEPIALGVPGRAAISLHLRAERSQVCGVDIGGTNCRSIAADLLGRPMGVLQRKTPKTRSAPKLAEWVAEIVAESTSGHAGNLVSVAVGLPGVVAPDTAKVSGAPNLPAVEGEEFVAELRTRLDVPLILDNDANLGVLGEMRFGTARGFGSVVLFSIGTGLGAGICLDGQLLNGRSGFVGEFGYLPIGPRGESLESLVAGAGLADQLRSLGGDIRTPTALFARPKPATKAIRNRFAQGLRVLLGAAATAYDPDLVVISGGLASSIEAMLPELAAGLTDALPSFPPVRVSELGGLGGALGAVAAACQRAYMDLGVDHHTAMDLPARASSDDLAALWKDVADVS